MARLCLDIECYDIYIMRYKSYGILRYSVVYYEYREIRAKRSHLNIVLKGELYMMKKNKQLKKRGWMSTYGDACLYMKMCDVTYGYEICEKSSPTDYVNLQVWFKTPRGNVYTFDRGGNTIDYGTIMYDDNASTIIDDVKEFAITESDGSFTADFRQAAEIIFSMIEKYVESEEE